MATSMRQAKSRKLLECPVTFRAAVSPPSNHITDGAQLAFSPRHVRSNKPFAVTPSHPGLMFVIRALASCP